MITWVGTGSGAGCSRALPPLPWSPLSSLVSPSASVSQPDQRPYPCSRAKRLGVVWRQDLTGTTDAAGFVPRLAGHEPEHCLRPAGC
jgi:hypothetical protein